jgi:hypothetical protein
MTNTVPGELNAVRSRWTSKDEAMLRELIERKKRIDEQNREPLRMIVRESSPAEIDNLGESVTDWLIENATQLRVLLEPFDLKS